MATRWVCLVIGWRPIPWPLRVLVWILVAVQLILPIAPELLADGINAPVPAAVSRSMLPPAAPVVKVNRTVPKVGPALTGLKFSAVPTDAEIARAPAFSAAIVSVGNAGGTPTENADLAAALVAYQNRSDPDDATALENFLQTHPNSPRYISLTSQLASHYRRTMQFSKALDAWQQIGIRGKDITDSNVRQIVDQAVAERGALLLTFGRLNEFKELLHELQGRPLHGVAAVKMADAKNALWQLENRPEKTFKCGPFSLSRIQATLDPSAPFSEKIGAELSTSNGTSLYQNWQLSKKMGLKYQMAMRPAGALVPVPSMVHWKEGHFSALTKFDGGRYQVEDSTFPHGWISAKALDAETSGYFLIPDGPLPVGWSLVTPEVGKTIFGKGSPTSGDSGAGGGDCTSGPPPAGGYGEGGPNTKPCTPRGMAQYTFNTMRTGLEIADVPVGYNPPIGPSVDFRLTYSEQTIYETGPFTHANLGNQWTFQWLTYIQDDTTSPWTDVNLIVNNGNAETFTGYKNPTNGTLYTGPGGLWVPNPTNGWYDVQYQEQGQLTRTSATSYQCLYPDGSLEIFSQPDTTNGPRRVFLTKQLDPAGNALTFTYDSSNRLVSVQDAIGQVTTLSYGLGSDIYKITQVTDPFGRFATFQYNGSGQLTNITDEIGITSSFQYGNAGGEADFINTLTTPYGTTTFTNNFLSSSDYSGRWLLATDPLGGQERMEFTENPAPSLLGPDPANLVPAGLNHDWISGETIDRMSFFWNKKTMQAMQGTIDYTKARQYVWDRTAANAFVLSRTLESIKQPMETARVWYNYPGQTSGDFEGTFNRPSLIARVLDDGTTQAQQYQYNGNGKPLQTVDPAGRTTYFTYAANNIDLLTVAQLAAGATNVLAQYTYNTQHLPLTAVDAAGNTNFFGYNTNGQLTALTNALSQVVTLAYDTNCYLTNIVGPLGMTNSFTYDSLGRVRTVTDSEGYTVTTSYDNLDRPTNVTYMDGTYEQIVYDKLDTALVCDRNGHWTAQVHDPLRHLTDVYDSIGRHTQMTWCTCGSLESITDPLGSVTAWIRDLQNRVTAKIYPDLTQTSYQYETNSSRLKSVTDAKSQSTLYSYFIDNNLKQVAYNNAVIATPSVNFTYDTNYNRLLTMVDGVGTNTFRYYAVTNGQLGAGMLSSVANTFTASTVTYNYDALGRITNRAIDGVAEQLTYDALGRVTVITNALGGFTNTYVRATGLIATNFAPFGKTTSFSYLGVTNDERLQTIWNQGSGGTLSKFDYAYDAVGQITNWTQQTDTTSTNVEVMQYDPVNQLLAVTVHGNTVAGAILQQYAYGYDASGNRTTEQIGTGTSGSVAISQSTYNSDNQVTSRAGGSGQMLFAGSLNEQATVSVAGSSATVNHSTTNFFGYTSVTNGTNVIPVTAADYSANSITNKYQVIITNSGVAKTLTFDLNGNETSVVTATSTNTYQWDAANRLLSVTGTTNQSLFTYDGLGRRVQIVELTNGVAMSTNKFLWDKAGLSEQRNVAGSVIKQFYWEGEQISGTNYYFTRDHLGSIREMVDASGTIQARYNYDPYGRRTKVSGSLDADFGFTGDFYHASSGLCLTFLRAYDPDLGRWLSRDLLAERAGLNLYDYVFNNPINWLDPYGACGGGGQVTGGAGGGGSSWWRAAAYIAGAVIIAAAVVVAGPEILVGAAIGAAVGAAWGAATANPGERWQGAGAGALGGAVGGATGGAGLAAFWAGAIGAGLGDVANRGTFDGWTVASAAGGGISGQAIDGIGFGDVAGGIVGGTLGQATQTVYVDAPHAALDAVNRIGQNYVNQLECQ